MINNIMPLCTHVINYLCCEIAISSALMSLYRYFKPKRLPDPEGPLSETLPSASIKAANKAVLASSKQQEELPSKPRKRGLYVKLTGV